MLSYIASMNNRQRKTFEAIFKQPTPANIGWTEVEALLMGLNSERNEGDGSRVRFKLNGVVSVFHRPHPGNECTRPQIRTVRDFLERSGNTPE